MRSFCFPTAILSLMFGAFAHADAPQLDHLFPAGVQRGTETIITCAGKFSWPVHVWVSAGTADCDEKDGQISVQVPDQFLGDRIWVRLWNEEGASELLPLIVGDLGELIEEEPNDTVSTGQSIPNGEPTDGDHPPGDPKSRSHIAATVNGRLQASGDVDVYTVALAQGQTCVASVAAHTALELPMDSILQITSESGTVLAQNHDAVGLDPRLVFTAPRDGVYAFRMFAFPSQPNSSIRFHGGKDYIYRLTLTTGPYLSYVIPMSVQDTGDPSNSNAREPTVSAIGWNLPSSLHVPVHPLTGISKSTFRECEPDGIYRTYDSTLAIARQPGSAGAVRVRLVPYLSVGRSFGNEPDTAMQVSVPQSVTGILVTAKQQDTYEIPLQAKQRIELTVESGSFHSHVVPTIQLINPKGTVVKEVGFTGAANDVKIDFTAAESGMHRVVIQDRFGHGSTQHVYRFTVREPRSDFSLSVAADRFTIPANERLEIPVTVQRHRGTNAEIDQVTITAVGLPDHINVSEVISQAKGDSSKQVTLKLESDGTPFQGLVQIRGQAQQEDEQGDLQRFARTPNRMGVCFDSVWLTVLASKP